jgi:hypothetical protein
MTTLAIITVYHSLTLSDLIVLTRSLMILVSFVCIQAWARRSNFSRIKRERETFMARQTPSLFQLLHDRTA